LEKYNLIAKTFSGLEPVLANEIKNIGGQISTRAGEQYFMKATRN